MTAQTPEARLRRFVDAWGDQARDVMETAHHTVLRVSDLRCVLDVLAEYRERDESATRVIERLRAEQNAPLRPAVCVLTYPHAAHPVTADHAHGEGAGHCSGVAPNAPPPPRRHNVRDARCVRNIFGESSEHARCRICNPATHGPGCILCAESGRTPADHNLGDS